MALHPTCCLELPCFCSQELRWRTCVPVKVPASEENCCGWSAARRRKAAQLFLIHTSTCSDLQTGPGTRQTGRPFLCFPVVNENPRAVASNLFASPSRSVAMGVLIYLADKAMPEPSCISSGKSNTVSQALCQSTKLVLDVGQGEQSADNQGHSTRDIHRWRDNFISTMSSIQV